MERTARLVPSLPPSSARLQPRQTVGPCAASRAGGTRRRQRQSPAPAEEPATVFGTGSFPTTAPDTASTEPATFMGALEKIQLAAGPEDDPVEAEAQGGENLNEESDSLEQVSGSVVEYSDAGLPIFYEDEALETEQAEAEEELEETDVLVTGNRMGRGARRRATPEGHIADELLPRVAVVGRPNVGKSALFNRLVGKQVAIVYDFPGITRDRLYTRGTFGSRDFMLVDTGGLMGDATALRSEERALAVRSLGAVGLPSAIERQAAAAVEESDAVILVVDGQTGSTAEDSEVLAWLRRSHPGKHVSLAVNKCENSVKADLQAAEFWEFGLEPVPVSAISGTGIGDLMEKLVAGLPPAGASDRAALANDATIAMAIVGRPNVGKSSLLNALVGEERAIVSPVAGTTRDAVDMDLVTPDGRSFTLIDTAGVRKRASIASAKDGAEPLMVERAFRAVRRAEVAVLVIDATEGITVQDFRLAEYIAEQGRACVVAVNKWDAIPAKTGTTLIEYEANVRAQLRPVEWANVVFVSAKTGQRVARVLDASVAAAEEHRRRLTTATLNLVLQEAVGWRAPPSHGSGKRGRIYYGTQAGIKPPSFVLFVNDPKLFADDYRKYIERQLRENVGFPGTPLRVFWRGKSSSSATD